MWAAMAVLQLIFFALDPSRLMHMFLQDRKSPASGEEFLQGIFL